MRDFIPNLTGMQPKHSAEEIAKFESEEDFMEAGVELLKQTITLLWIIIGLKYHDQEQKPKSIDRYEAVIGGNMVRLIKLNTSFLQNICELKSEISFIIARCLSETYINLKYILLEGEDRVKRNYIKHSLTTEKELWNIIKGNISKRGGDTLEIENRMNKSIEGSFDSSDFQLDEVHSSSKWKSIAARSEKVASPDFYEIFYGLASHSVHGNWQDILFNHVTQKEEEYFLNTQWIKPRPQMMDGPIALNLDLINLFAEKKLEGDQFKALLIEKSKMLDDYHHLLMTRHEQLLAK